MPHLSLDSPIGPLTLHQDDGALVSVSWGRKSAGEETPLLQEAKQQLDDYFARKRRAFDLPLAPSGSAFEQSVWRLMCEIPFGDTMTYGAMAKRLGGTARAVGGACGSNRIPVIIPCHRVLGVDGKLIGYSGRGGIETKVALLQHEGVLL